MNKQARIKLVSFGFKYGIPKSNYYFDVSFIKNPAREEKWNLFSDTDQKMKLFILNQKYVIEFIDNVIILIELLSKVDQNQIFAFGCSAGRHRSTTIVNTISELLIEKGVHVNVEHRDLE